MILVAVDSQEPRHRLSVEVRAGDVVYIGRNPFHGGLPPEPGAKLFRIPWSDRLVNRHHSVARVTAGGASLQVCAPSEGESPRSPLSRLCDGGWESAERVELAIGASVGIGKRPRTLLALVASPAEAECVFGCLAGGGHADGDAARVDPAGSIPHAVRVQLRLFEEELPRRLARWRSAEKLFDGAAGFLEVAARNLGVGRSVWSFYAAPPGADWTPDSVVALTSDHTSIAGFGVNPAWVAELSGESGFGVRRWTRACSDESPGEGASVMGARLEAPVAEGRRAAVSGSALVYRGREVFLYGEMREAPPEAVEAMARMVPVATGLVSALLGVHEYLRREEQMKAYFSPRLRAFVTEHPDRLVPAIHPCTILFCDRRSSSKMAEAATTDAEVLQLLRANQDILGRVTDVVFHNDGAVADFAGDCVLGFWGWPPREGDPPHALAAAGAAREIVERLADLVRPDGERLPVCRVGIATGNVAVGNVGPAQQMKISLFGNSVNLASRLEGLGKKFRVPVLMAEETAAALRGDGRFLVRRLCRLRPAGFGRAYPIYELVLPRELLGSAATPEQIALYEAALADFERRDWAGALSKLRQLPGDDEPAFWLAREVDRCREQPPPPEWQGEVEVREK